MPGVTGPLSAKDYERINEQLAELSRLKQAIEQAATAGCDVAEHRQHCDFVCQRLEAIKRTYFPDRP